ncbi:MAG: alpha-1,2-fucosyltransferase [Phycisphaerales bacterium]|nr:alpha-1,2-fucosyltransferase [Phycisphaerales bacterium]
MDVREYIKKWYPKNSNEYQIGIHLRLGNNQDNFEPTISSLQFYLKSLDGAIKKNGKNKSIKLLIATDNLPKASVFIDAFKNKIQNIHILKDFNYIEMFVLSNCDAFIASQSTFSWWCAYLGNQEKENYFDEKYNIQDHLPKDWHQL